MAAPVVHLLARIAFITTAYALSARLGQALGFDPGLTPTVWPASGVALAALVVWGRRPWPGVLLGAFGGTAWTLFDPAAPIATAATATLIAAGATAQVLAGRALLAADPPRGGPLDRPQGAFRVGAVAAMTGLIGPTVGVPALWLGGFLPASACGPAWAAGWVGDTAAALLFAPLVLAWSNRRGTALGAARYGRRGTTAAGVGLAAVVLACTAAGLGPFAVPNRVTSFLLVQGFVATAAVTGLALAAATAARDAAGASLRVHARVLENMAEGVSLADEAGVILYANPALNGMFGYAPGELLGANVRVLSDRPQGDTARLVLGVADALRAGGVWRSEARNRRKDGTTLRTAARITRLDVNGGRLWLCVYEDITARRRAEAALRESESVLRSFYDSAPALMGVVEPDGDDIIHVSDNPAAARFFRRTPAELRGRRASELGVPADLLALWLARYAKSGRTGRPVRFEYPHHGPGGVRHLSATVAPAGVGPSGRPRFSYMVTDVTGAKRAEKALREAEAVRQSELRLGTLAAAAPGFLFTNRPDGWSDYTSRRFYEYTGLPDGAADGFGWAAAVHPDDRAGAATHFAECVRAGRTYEWECRFRAADGSYRWFFTRSVPVLDDEGRVVMWCGICTDIDAQKRAEAEVRLLNQGLEQRVADRTRELLLAKEAAEAANRAKGEFLANVSHELRTPLNGILGMTDLVLGGSVAADQRDRLGLVKESAGALLVLVNDLLDLAKIEAGKLELAPVRFDLHDAVGRAVSVLAGRAHQKGLAVVCDIAPGVPREVVGDPDRLRQVLINLVGNAVKFTDTGGVSIRVTSDESDELVTRHSSLVTLDFTVTDTGIGIPAEKHAVIFRPFEQADGSVTRRYGGTGLGLSIVDRLTRLMGGGVRVESAPGRGSTFTATARFAPVSGEAVATAPVVPPPGGRSLTLLLAEDNRINQRLAEDLLARAGHRVVTVGNGRAAAAAYATAIFDAVLMDVQMPEADGFAATAAIRARERGTGRRTPVVAMTARAMPGDEEECLRAGMDAYVPKPLDPARLLQVLAELTGGGPATPAGPTRALPPALVAEMAGVFLVDAPQYLTDARAALAAGDAGRLDRAAHRLAGAAGCFKAAPAVAAARRLERIGRAGDLAGAAPALAELEDEVGRLAAALRDLPTRES